MIRFGPAGIPLSCKGRTMKDGIEDVHNLSLTAMEIQMVRAGVSEVPPDDEEIGLSIRDIDSALVVGVIRDDELICDPKLVIEEDDFMIQMNSGVTGSFGDLYNVGRMAKRLDISMSMHTPNYMDLGSDSDLTYECINSIKFAAIMADALGGDTVVTNLGLYHKGADREDIDNNIMMNVEEIMDWWKSTKIKPKLGVEITGQQDVFGSLEQILELCENVDNVVPVVNFPHHHARTRGSLVEPEDFKDLIETVSPYNEGRVYSIFAGVEHADGNEQRLTPIKKGDLKFDALGECLADLKPEIKIISSSPLLEHDAMYMRIIHERYLNKRVAKALRIRKKEAEESVNEA
ncbi:MAG: TIM barrel protein [Candidatus Methanomethylophilaceae archaeon]|jgi:deoxyribonuclease-4|nr:TIM barrel protein [Candidatus Methanomethylophilaceae archaeon]MDD3128511.1 TIM barrel protein [Candidatus Methanomethylophilaceae archaeon]MDD4118856.1 TIM barrel protein [Candidatus Methanomethylophilaceae archaeon]MDD4454525.1 TIM barrel protein [Candidatus Methanomethylophilaceae archaeon]MDI9378566.1 TIM barrel protein [Candidatus Thermoplasmatota archaeon]